MIRAPQEVVALDLEQARFDAVVEGRWDDFAAICHPDLVYVHATGAVDSRDSYLRKLRGGHYDYHWIDSRVEKVWSSASTVLLWGRMRAELRAGEVAKTIDNHILTVWVVHGGKWLLVAQQPTAQLAST